MGESLSKVLDSNLPLSESTSHGQQITVEVELNQTDPLLDNREESNEIDEKSDFLTEPTVPSENNSDDEEDLVWNFFANDFPHDLHLQLCHIYVDEIT